MDNIQGTVNADPSQGQSAPVAQVPSSDAGSVSTTSGTSVGTTNQPAGEAGQEFQIPDKFQGKSVEDIAKAYVELESHNKKVEMDRAELEKMFTPQFEPTATQEPVATFDSDEDPMKTLVSELSPKLREEMSKLLSPALAKLELNEVVSRYGNDFIQMAPDVKKLREQNPSLTLDAAYKIASFDNLQRTARNEGIAQASKAQEQAQKAQVETARPSGYKAETIESAVGNKNIPLSEIVDALGPEYAAFAETTKRRSGKK